MNADPRKKFSTATRFEKIKRSALYRVGQHRLWFDARNRETPKGRLKLTGRLKIKGPVKLLHIYKRANINEVPLSERLWICELMWRDEERIIGEYDLGTQVTEMEAIAWAVKVR